MSIPIQTDNSVQLTYSSFPFTITNVDNYATSNQLIISSNQIINKFNTDITGINTNLSTNYYNKTSTDTALALKQNTLTAATNLLGVGSAITALDYNKISLNKPNVFPADMTDIYNKFAVNNLITNTSNILKTNIDANNITTSNSIYGTAYTNERQYPPKTYNTSISQSSISYLTQSPIYYETISLNTDGISYGSGNYEIYSSTIDTSMSYTGTINNVINDTNYSYISFTTTGTLTLSNNLICDILIVGGGGGGGNSGTVSWESGGGGAGGVVYMVNKQLNSGTYNIVVGNGGTGNTNGNDSKITDISNNNITFDGINLIGKGGGRGATNGGIGGDGASGGGGTHPSTNGGVATQGNTFWNGSSYVAGGFNGGKPATNSRGAGGGGAKEIGDTDGIGFGGDGVQVNITGNNSYYAGGGNTFPNTSASGSDGGGGVHNAGNGVANTGGGGAGGYGSVGAVVVGGTGGSGIVIIRFLKPSKKELFNYITNETGSQYESLKYNYTNGNYIGTTNYIKTGYYGDFLVIKLPAPIMLNRFQIYSRIGYKERAPSLWRFYGSTNNIDWEEIIDASITTALDVNHYSLDYYEKIVNNQTKNYLYFGIVVSKIIGGIANANTLNFTELKLFGRDIIPFSPLYLKLSGGIMYGDITGITTLNATTINTGTCSATTFLGSGASLSNISYANISGKPTTFPATMTDIYTKTETNNLLGNKQDTLTATTNLLGVGSAITALDYNKITLNKPLTFPATMTDIYTKTETDGRYLKLDGTNNITELLNINAADNTTGGTKGIIFRSGYNAVGTNYNCSILTYDHDGQGFCDGLSINGWDGISFCTNANTRNERMRIDKDGNVNIGTTGQAYKLYVNGTSYLNGNSAVNGTITATTFSGSGASLTNIPYANITGKPTNFQSDWLTTIINKPSTFPVDMTNIYTKTETDGRYLHLSGGNMTSNIGFGIATPDSKIHIATPDNSLITTNIFNFKNTSGYGIYTTSSTIANRGNTLDFFSRDYNGGTITTRNILSLNISGNVGIGTTNPSNILQVGDGGKFRISNGISDYTLIGTKDVDNGTNTRIVISGNTRSGGGNIDYVATSSTGAHKFYTTDSLTERMRIDSAGNVGIGTNNPSCKLSLGSSVGYKVLSLWDNATPNNFQFVGFGNNDGLCFNTNTSTDAFQFRVGATTTTATELMRLSGTGNLSLGTTDTASYKMRIRGANPTFLRIETDTSAVAQVSGIEFGIPGYTSAGTAKITSTTYASDVNDLRFSTSSGTNATSIKMTINGNGNISCTNDFTALGRITGNNITLSGQIGKINVIDDYHYIEFNQSTDTTTIMEYGTISLNIGPSKSQKAYINSGGMGVNGSLNVSGTTSTGIINLSLGGTSGVDDNTNMKILMNGVSSGATNAGAIIIRAYNDIKFYSNGQGTTPNLFIDGIYGLVGVGGITPVAKLHVNSGTYTTGWLGNIALINSGSLNVVYWGNTFGGICAIFETNVWCKTNIMASSDSRIKKDIEDIDDTTALDKILSIQPKTYKYKDTLLKRDNRVIGFIAQQIKEVIPEAVELIPEYIPNIYKISTTNDDIINLDNTELLNVDDKIKIIDNSGKTEETKILEVNETYIKIDKTFNNEDVFVYGSKVDDFHSLDKSYIYTLNVCATQQLYKLIQLQEERIRILEEKLASF